MIYKGNERMKYEDESERGKEKKLWNNKVKKEKSSRNHLSFLIVRKNMCRKLEPL
jgi:hypothetical protein